MIYAVYAWHRSCSFPPNTWRSFWTLTTRVDRLYESALICGLLDRPASHARTFTSGAAWRAQFTTGSQHPGRRLAFDSRGCNKHTTSCQASIAYQEFLAPDSSITHSIHCKLVDDIASEYEPFRMFQLTSPFKMKWGGVLPFKTRPKNNHTLHTTMKSKSGPLPRSRHSKQPSCHSTKGWPGCDAIWGKSWRREHQLFTNITLQRNRLVPFVTKYADWQHLGSKVVFVYNKRPPSDRTVGIT